MDSESQALRTSADRPDSVDSAQWKLLAYADFLEDLAATATGGQQEIPRDRLEEDVHLCMDLDRCILPLGLILAATATLGRQDVASLLSCLPTLLTGEVLASLDRVSETILMIDDSDIQASGVVVTSVLVLRALPPGISARDRVMTPLMDLVDLQLKERKARHSEVFSPLRHVERTPTLGQLPHLLSEISDALEDLACDHDVFLDNPVELAPKTRVVTTSSDELFKRARVQSGASLPALSDEMEQIDALAESLGWDLDRGMQLATELYQRSVMDSRSKLGITPAVISSVVADLRELHDEPVKDIRLDDSTTAAAPYAYDAETATLILNVAYRGGFTTRVIEEEHPKVLEELREAKADREATTLSRAIDRYRKAREAAGGEPVPEEDETADVEALGARLGLPPAEAYGLAATLYDAKRLPLSSRPEEGLTLRAIRDLLESVGESARIAKIVIDPEAPGYLPLHVDADGRALVFHTAFERLTSKTIDRFLGEWALEPFPLAEPDEAPLAEYQKPREPGSIASPDNIRRFIAEFGFSAEDAPDAFEVLLEDSAAFRDRISIQALRVVVATLNARLGPGEKVDMVTGWTRDLPDTQDPDRLSIAWIASHTEEGTTLNMLTFNFGYGEGKGKLPPLSDDVILHWCRHYRVESRAEG